VAFDACRIHHVVYWFHGGASDLDNLIPLCEIHHHLVHDGGWTLQLSPGRRATWRTPDGTPHFDGGTIDRTRCARTMSAGTTVTQALADELELALAAVTSRAPP
jgi:hypothetical protein